MYIGKLKVCIVLQLSRILRQQKIDQIHLAIKKNKKEAIIYYNIIEWDQY